jgi:hypothetical protein
MKYVKRYQYLIQQSIPIDWAIGFYDIYKDGTKTDLKTIIGKNLVDKDTRISSNLRKFLAKYCQEPNEWKIVGTERYPLRSHYGRILEVSILEKDGQLFSINQVVVTEPTDGNSVIALGLDFFDLSNLIEEIEREFDRCNLISMNVRSLAQALADL